MLTTINYKIRNPLTNIIGVLSLLDYSNLNDSNKKYMNIIKQSSYDIVSVAKDLIDIINLESDKIIITLENINIKKFVNECYNIISNDAKKKNIELISKLDKDIPHIIISDEKRLQQIIINILNNAINFTSFGNIIVEISLFNKKNDINNCPFDYKVQKSQKYNILFKIKDNGIGMNQKKQNSINNVLGIKKLNFIKSYKNPGFGLLISKCLCNLMGGNIWFKSEIDMGTIFYFNIICDGIILDI